MEITLKDYTKSSKFGWGWSCTPSGDGPYSIEIPKYPDHEGTPEQVRQAILGDRTYQSVCNSGAFYNVAWFYKGLRIVKTWGWTILKARTTPAYRDDGTYNHDNDDTVYGYGWIVDSHPANRFVTEEGD